MDKYIYNFILNRRSNRKTIPNISKLIESWFDTNKITATQWPAQSPDIKPSENLWKQLNDKYVCMLSSEMLKNCK